MTKSFMLDAAMMRLAQEYGDAFLTRSIAPYVPGAAAAGWNDVTFEDLANMASGRGPAGKPTCYLCDYTRWYLAPSEAEKTAQALNYPKFTRPGTVYNYRDQDAYLLGVAREGFLMADAGASANIWTMLLGEVYRPIGIFAAPTNTTIEASGPGHAMMAYGYYPTLDDLAKLAMLYQNGGAWRGWQILSRRLVQTLLPRPTLPPGALAGTGEHYLFDWHIVKIRASSMCTRYVPRAEGWAGTPSRSSLAE